MTAVERAWYALRTRSNCERKVVRFIEGRGAPETFLPTYRAKTRRLGVMRVVERPLFTGYVFVALGGDGSERVAALQAPGAVGFVCFGGRTARIDDRTMRSLRILVSRSDEARPHPLLREGQAVRVVDGPFAGATGKVSRGRGRKPRLVVTIEILGRAAAAPIDLRDVEPF
ncbi:MAG: transcription termination/antitermination NusG family protein [Myxococcota bacterium]|nr:transcription termination/antitermination NusG family protein [Myxococcota bacterium]